MVRDKASIPLAGLNNKFKISFVNFRFNLPPLNQDVVVSSTLSLLVLVNYIFL